VGSLRWISCGSFNKLYVKYPEYDFIDHIFHANLNRIPEVKLSSKEHKDFKWMSPKDALNLPLVKDEDSCIEMFYEK